MKGATHIWVLNFAQAGLAGMAKAQAISDAAAQTRRLGASGLRRAEGLSATTELTGKVSLRAR